MGSKAMPVETFKQSGVENARAKSRGHGIAGPYKTSQGNYFARFALLIVSRNGRAMIIPREVAS